jgi:hypothetical protein
MKKAMSWIPDKAPPRPVFRVLMRERRGRISATSASEGSESHDFNFFTS